MKQFVLSLINDRMKMARDNVDRVQIKLSRGASGAAQMPPEWEMDYQRLLEHYKNDVLQLEQAIEWVKNQPE